MSGNGEVLAIVPAVDQFSTSSRAMRMARMPDSTSSKSGDRRDDQVVDRSFPNIGRSPQQSGRIPANPEEVVIVRQTQRRKVDDVLTRVRCLRRGQ